MTTQHPRMDTMAGLAPAGALPIDLSVKHVFSREAEQSVSQRDLVQFDAKVSSKDASVSLGSKSSDVHKVGEKYVMSDEYSRNIVVIYARGDEYEPKWSFESTDIDGYMRGNVKTWLADMDVLGFPFQLTAKFKTSYQNIRIEEVDGPAFHELKPQRRLIVKERLRKYIYSQIEDYLSKVDISHEG